MIALRAELTRVLSELWGPQKGPKFVEDLLAQKPLSKEEFRTIISGMKEQLAEKPKRGPNATDKLLAARADFERQIEGPSEAYFKANRAFDNARSAAYSRFHDLLIKESMEQRPSAIEDMVSVDFPLSKRPEAGWNAVSSLKSELYSSGKYFTFSFNGSAPPSAEARVKAVFEAAGNEIVPVLHKYIAIQRDLRRRLDKMPYGRNVDAAFQALKAEAGRAEADASRQIRPIFDRVLGEVAQIEADLADWMLVPLRNAKVRPGP